MYFPNKINIQNPDLQISLQIPRLTVTEFNRAVEVLQKASTTKSLKPGVQPGGFPPGEPVLRRRALQNEAPPVGILAFCSEKKHPIQNFKFPTAATEVFEVFV